MGESTSNALRMFRKAEITSCGNGVIPKRGMMRSGISNRIRIEGEINRFTEKNYSRGRELKVIDFCCPNMFERL